MEVKWEARGNNTPTYKTHIRDSTPPLAIKMRLVSSFCQVYAVYCAGQQGYNVLITSRWKSKCNFSYFVHTHKGHISITYYFWLEIPWHTRAHYYCIDLQLLAATVDQIDRTYFVRDIHKETYKNLDICAFYQLLFGNRHAQTDMGPYMKPDNHFIVWYDLHETHTRRHVKQHE